MAGSGRRLPKVKGPLGAAAVLVRSYRRSDGVAVSAHVRKQTMELVNRNTSGNKAPKHVRRKGFAYRIVPEPRLRTFERRLAIERLSPDGAIKRLYLSIPNSRPLRPNGDWNGLARFAVGRTRQEAFGMGRPTPSVESRKRLLKLVRAFE